MKCFFEGTQIDQQSSTRWHAKNINSLQIRGLANGGAIITEFSTRYVARSAIRNRIISGMTMGVLLIEAGENSGASPLGAP